MCRMAGAGLCDMKNIRRKTKNVVGNVLRYLHICYETKKKNVE